MLTLASSIALQWPAVQSPSSALQATVLLLLLTAAWMAYNLFFKLRGIPGPTFSRLGIPGQSALWALQLRWIWKVAELHDKYGSVVRIGPNQVNLNSAEAVRKIYSHGSAYLKPKRFYDGFVQVKDHPTVFSETNPSAHARRRKEVAAAYALNYLIKLEECVDPLIDELIGTVARETRAQEALHGNSTLDVTKLCHFFAMDAVGELAFGSSFGLLSSGSDPQRFLRGVSNLSQWGAAYGMMPWKIGDWIRPLVRFILGEPGGEVIVPATSQRIATRYRLLSQGTEPSRPDMLSKFIEGIAGKQDPTQKQGEVLFTSLSIVGAGSDTTSLALSATLRYVVGHPHCYLRLQQEVDEAFESGSLTEPCSYAAAVRLDYLQACIKEALRLHPPISMSLPRIVPSGGDIIDGRFFPAGTIVGVSPYLLHRNTDVWGADAAAFRPERWLDASEETIKTQARNFFSFGGGARQCIGRNISMMEITKALPRLLWHFQFDLLPGLTTRHLSPRSTEGVHSEHEPWHVSSGWFLNAEELIMQVRARRPEELEDLLESAHEK